jgi:hypothetical protein
MNAGSAPGAIFGYHAEDQIPDLLGNSLPTNPASHLRDQGPIQTKAGSMPTNHGLRGNDNQRLLPVRPTPTSEHPEKLVEHAELGFGVFAFQNGELLPERQILDEQVSTRTKNANEYS